MWRVLARSAHAHNTDDSQVSHVVRCAPLAKYFRALSPIEVKLLSGRQNWRLGTRGMSRTTSRAASPRPRAPSPSPREARSQPLRVLQSDLFDRQHADLDTLTQIAKKYDAPVALAKGRRPSASTLETPRHMYGDRLASAPGGTRPSAVSFTLELPTPQRPPSPRGSAASPPPQRPGSSLAQRSSSPQSGGSTPRLSTTPRLSSPHSSPRRQRPSSPRPTAAALLQTASSATIELPLVASCAAECTATGDGLRQATPREEARFTIVARDAAGQPRRVGGERFKLL